MPQFAPVQTVQLGDVQVTYLADGGGIASATATFPGTNESQWTRYEEHLNADGRFITSIGGFLIAMSGRYIIVDLGIGPQSLEFPGFGTYAGGQFLESLAQTGVNREQISDVVFTHLHLDHCGWVTMESNGSRGLTFPKARYLITQAEWDFWHGGDNPAGPHPEYVQKPLEGRLTFISPSETIAPGLTVIDTHGHTPGHISLQLQAGEPRLFLIGDLMYGEMQLQETDWNVAFDTDPAQAQAARERLLPQLTAPNVIVAANHFSDTVFGRIHPRKDAYGWLPLEA